MNPELEERTKNQISNQLLGLSNHRLSDMITTQKLLRNLMLKILIKFFLRKLFLKLPTITWISVVMYIIYLVITL